MKKMAKKAVAAVLGYQVRKLVRKNDIKVVGVVGSIGKTSTKLAIVDTLKAGLRVQSQDGNYNDLVTVPLVFFGEPLQELFNPLAWLNIFYRNQRQLRRPYPYDVVVLEIGTDAPGQVSEFKKYLKLEIGVITAITPEHMQFFDTLDDVAREEMEIGTYSTLLLANKDLCDPKYLKNASSLLTYSLNDGDFKLAMFDIDPAKLSVVEQYSRLAAAAVASKLGLSPEQIKKGLNDIEPPAGRMQMLKGVNNSVIIDDSYNSSPAAVKLALDYLYETTSAQKIAVLGSMNEMGGYSQQAHEEVGDYCDPKRVDLVVTIGTDAQNYLAPKAISNGCKVQSFNNPYTAGDYLRPIVKKDALILVKGSQNGVFAEETIKVLLANPKDAHKLVRQSAKWMKIKHKAFKR